MRLLTCVGVLSLCLLSSCTRMSSDASKVVDVARQSGDNPSAWPILEEVKDEGLNRLLNIKYVPYWTSLDITQVQSPSVSDILTLNKRPDIGVYGFKWSLLNAQGKMVCQGFTQPSSQNKMSVYAQASSQFFITQEKAWEAHVFAFKNDTSLSEVNQEIQATLDDLSFDCTESAFNRWSWDGSEKQYQTQLSRVNNALIFFNAAPMSAFHVSKVVVDKVKEQGVGEVWRAQVFDEHGKVMLEKYLHDAASFTWEKANSWSLKTPTPPLLAHDQITILETMKLVSKRLEAQKEEASLPPAPPLPSGSASVKEKADYQALLKQYQTLRLQKLKASLADLEAISN